MSVKKNVLLQLVVQIVVTSLGFIAGIFLTRYLGAEGKGVLAMIEANVQLFLMLFSVNAAMAIVYFSANKKIKDSIVWSLSLLSIATTIGMIGLVVFFLNLTGLENIIFPKNYFTFAGIGYLITISLTTQFNNYFTTIFRGNSIFIPIFALSFIHSLLNLIIYGLLYFYQYSIFDFSRVYIVFICNITISLVILSIWAILFKSKLNISPKIKFDWKLNLKKFYKYGSVGYLAIIVGFLNLKLDIWLVDNYLGSKQLGFYALAVNVAGLLLLMSQSFRWVLFPYITKGDMEENIRNLKFFSRINFTSTLFIGLLLFFGSDFIIRVLYGEEFVDSILPLKILVFALMIMSFQVMFTMYNFARNNSKFNLYANLLSISITIMLNVILIPRIGIKGAAVTSLTAYSVSTIFILYSIFVLQKLPIGNYFFPSKDDYKDLYSLIKTKIA